MNSWKKELQTSIDESKKVFVGPSIQPRQVDFERLVCIDFETYYDTHYSLRKMSTSGYVRDAQFKIQMMGIKVGLGPTTVFGTEQIADVLKSIEWGTHSLLCHNTQFDGFILSHHFDIVPAYYYDSLSMARGLHSNDIGAGLDEVSMYYGGQGKIEGVLETTKGERDWDQDTFDAMATYCIGDVNEMLHVFNGMLPKMPCTEMDIIDLTMRMFCDPVLMVDIPRVQKEYERELKQRDNALASVINPADYYDDKTVLKTKNERAMVGKERDDLVVKRVIGSSSKFADLLRAENVEPPLKVSPAWLKKPASEREEEEQTSYAFAKDDIDFLALPDNHNLWGEHLDLNDVDDVKQLVATQTRLRNLVDARLAIKSVGNATKAERFLADGSHGMRLPVGYSYYRAHTGRYGGNNKINMQNLERGGELRQSILAPPGHVLIVADSGQIEARVNAWLWGQKDLLESFRVADAYDAKQAKLPKSKQKIATGANRDAYCKFADSVYSREITKHDKLERFVGKVCVLGLGYQMGANTFQLTLAKGALGGPPVHFDLKKCRDIVTTYRSKNNFIFNGWATCGDTIESMALKDAKGTLGPLNYQKETIWLPNGMALKYPDLRSEMNDGRAEWSYRVKDRRTKIYSGKLCENIVQALARIIVCSHQMLEIAKTMRVVMTTHDEIVTCVPEKQADQCFARMLQIMQTPPPWCADLPLTAEGGYAYNYSK